MAELLENTRELEEILSILSTKAESKGDDYYNLFWDLFLANNVNGNYFFAGKGWTDLTFKPNKDLIIKDWTQRVFYNTGEIDVAARLTEKKLKIDMSQCKNCSYFAMDTEITTFPEIDTSTLGSLNYFIYNNKKLRRIEKIILKTDGSQKFLTTSFGANNELTHVIFEGCIGQDGFDIRNSSKLDKDSIISIINCLSTTTTGLTIKLSKTAVDNAFNGGSEGTEWQELKNTRLNWNIEI